MTELLSEKFVSLRNGPDVPLDVFRLALDLELRGARFTVADGKLRIDGLKVSAEEAAALKRWKPHVIALVEYRAPEVGVDEGKAQA